MTNHVLYSLYTYRLSFWNRFRFRFTQIWYGWKRDWSQNSTRKSRRAGNRTKKSLCSISINASGEASTQIWGSLSLIFMIWPYIRVCIRTFLRVCFWTILNPFNLSFEQSESPFNLLRAKSKKKNCKVR